MNASHEVNQPLAQEITAIAAAKNVLVAHNASSFAKFDGQHRYLVLKSGAPNATIRSKDLVAYWETRYSRYGEPSIIGEAQCLGAMLRFLKKL